MSKRILTEDIDYLEYSKDILIELRLFIYSFYYKLKVIESYKRLSNTLYKEKFLLLPKDITIIRTYSIFIQNNINGNKYTNFERITYMNNNTNTQYHKIKPKNGIIKESINCMYSNFLPFFRETVLKFEKK